MVNPISRCCSWLCSCWNDRVEQVKQDTVGYGTMKPLAGGREMLKDKSADTGQLNPHELPSKGEKFVDIPLDE